MSGVEPTKEVLALRKENAEIRKDRDLQSGWLSAEKAITECLKRNIDDLRQQNDTLKRRLDENALLAEELEDQHELNTRLRKDLLAANDEVHRLRQLISIIRKNAKLAKA